MSLRWNNWAMFCSSHESVCVRVPTFETMKKISLINLLRISFYYYFKWTLTTTTRIHTHAHTHIRMYTRTILYYCVRVNCCCCYYYYLYMCIQCMIHVPCVCTVRTQCMTESRKFSMKTKMAFYLLPFWSPNFTNIVTYDSQDGSCPVL